MMIKRIPAITVLAVAALVAPAFAGDFYVVGAAGRSSIDADPASIDAVGRAQLGASATTVSTNDVGWKLQLGYKLTPGMALEGGYTDLGKSTYINANPAYTASGSKRANLINLDLVGSTDTNRPISFFARLGGYRWSTTADLPYAGGMRSMKDNGFDIKAGVGLQYNVNQNLGLRLEFERYNGVGKQSTAGDSKANLYSLGAVLMF